MRLAILGGSFDPPHVGHLLAAYDACAQLRLDKLIFVPTGVQPLKPDAVGASGTQRLAMVRAMVAAVPAFEVSSLEVDRPGLSFTVDTVRHFAIQHPAAERYLLLGADVLSTFAQWRDPAEIVRLAQPVVLLRGTEERVPAELAGAPLTRIPTRRFDVSSTEIRERVRQGKPLRGFVTDGVAELIARERLYC